MSKLFFPSVVVAVTRVEDVQAAVWCAKKLGCEINVMGGGHSYEAGYTTDGIMISMNDFNGLIAVDLNTDPHNAWIYTQVNIIFYYCHKWIKYFKYFIYLIMTVIYVII